MYAVAGAHDLPKLDTADSSLAQLEVCSGSIVKLRLTISACRCVQLPPLVYAALHVHALSSSGACQCSSDGVVGGCCELQCWLHSIARHTSDHKLERVHTVVFILVSSLLQVLRNLVQAFKLLAEAPAAPVSAGMDLLKAHRQQASPQVMPHLSNLPLPPSNSQFPSTLPRVPLLPMSPRMLTLATLGRLVLSSPLLIHCGAGVLDQPVDANLDSTSVQQSQEAHAMHWQQLFEWQMSFLGICQKHMVNNAVFSSVFCCLAPHNKLCSYAKPPPPPPNRPSSLLCSAPSL